MAKITILIGAPGSGKSTFAKEQLESNPRTAILNRDSLRLALKTTYKVEDSIEAIVTETQSSMLKSLMNRKYDIIIDNTHCNIKVLRELNNEIRKNDRHGIYTIEYKMFSMSLESLLFRNRTRNSIDRVPEEVINRMYNNYNTILIRHNRELDYIFSDKYELPEIEKKDYSHLDSAIIVDIDGTIADMGKLRGPFDWKKVHLDKPKDDIIDLVNLFDHMGYKIIFMSGRSEDARKLTEEWLDKHLHSVVKDGGYELHMRASDDYRKDSIVKKELYQEHIEGKYNVRYVLDDRNQVVDMWRNVLGLTVLQVAEGDF